LAQAWKGPFKDLQVMYTGGITRQNLADIVKQDPAGFFCGSGLTALIDNPAAMKKEAEDWLAIIKEHTNS